MNYKKLVPSDTTACVFKIISSTVKLRFSDDKINRLWQRFIYFNDLLTMEKKFSGGNPMCDMPRCSRTDIEIKYHFPMMFRGKVRDRTANICERCWNRHCKKSSDPKHKNIKQTMTNIVGATP